MFLSEVTETMTPSGVEQEQRAGHDAVGPLVTETMTPSGVEQVLKSTHLDKEDRDRDDDALGR